MKAFYFFFFSVILKGSTIVYKYLVHILCNKPKIVKICKKRLENKF